MQFARLFKKLDSLVGFDAKIEVLKKDYPAVFMDYCRHYNLKKELDDYMAECMELKDSKAQNYA